MGAYYTANRERLLKRRRERYLDASDPYRERVLKQKREARVVCENCLKSYCAMWYLTKHVCCLPKGGAANVDGGGVE